MTPWENMPPNKHTGLAMTPRRWQAEALPTVRDALRAGKRPVVVASTGSGKAVLLTELARLLAGRNTPNEVIVISAPTVALVEQLRADLGARIGTSNVGAYYTSRKDTAQPVIVTCNPSAGALVTSLAINGRRVRAWIADECHRTQSDGVKDAIRGSEPRWLCGFTATPFRSVETESLELFDAIAYRYGLVDATKEGVLVPYTVRWPTSTMDGATIDDAVVAMIRALPADAGAGVVGAMTIPDAKAFADRLTAEGIPAAPISSETPRAERALILGRLQRGELRALVHVALLIEGVDLPWLRWLCLRRPITSPVALIQQLGRVLRSYPGKTGAVVLDPHGLLEGSVVPGRPDAIGEALEAAAEREAQGKPRDPNAVPQTPIERYAVAVAESTQWARSVLLQMHLSGAIEARASGAGWRSEDATPAQLTSLDRMAKAWSRYLPDDVAAGVAALRAASHVQGLPRGAVSDILSILHAVARQAPEGGWEARKGWTGPTWPAGLVFPAAPETGGELLKAERRHKRATRDDSGPPEEAAA